MSDKYIVIYWDDYSESYQNEFVTHREDAEKIAIQYGPKSKVYELILVSQVVEKIERIVE